MDQLKEIDAVLRIPINDLVARDVAQVALQDLRLEQLDQDLEVLSDLLLTASRLQVVEVDLRERRFEELQVEGVAV